MIGLHIRKADNNGIDLMTKARVDYCMREVSNFAQQDYNKFIIMSKNGLYNLFDIDGMIRFLHPDIEFVNVSGKETNVHTYGIEQFKEIANKGKALFSSRRQTIKKIDFIDHKVIVEIAFEGILANDIPDGLKKGEKIILDGQSEYVLKDDLFIKITDIS